MATDRIVGIDLGTTNSLVAFMQGDSPVVIPGDDGSNLVPSVVALDENNQAVIGNAADLSTEDDFNEFANNIADNVVRGGAAIVADVAEDGVTTLKTMMQGLGGTVLS